MNRKAYYTAIGRFERRTDSKGQKCPVIRLGGNEYMADIQEMVIWTSLNWRITHMEEIGTLYENSIRASGFTSDRSWEACVERLLMRGLLVCGTGETDFDALYDLLASLYIIPAEGPILLRILTFLRLTILDHVPVSAAKRLFRRDKRTENEKRVMVLARQALLSTAEIIKCTEKGVFRLPDEESILDCVYDDRDTTSDNIPFLARSSPSSRDVILAVANLYLRQQIIFERI